MIQTLNKAGLIEANGRGAEITVDDAGRVHIVIDPAQTLKETDKSIMHAQARWTTVGWDANGHKTYVDVQCGTSRKVDKNWTDPNQAKSTEESLSPEKMLATIKQNPDMLAALLAKLGVQAAPTQNSAPQATETPETGTVSDGDGPRHGLETDAQLNARMGAQSATTATGNGKVTRTTRKAGSGKRGRGRSKVTVKPKVS